MAAEPPLPRFFLVLMVGSSVLLGAVLLPILRELLVAAVIAALLWPPQQWLKARLGRRGAAASVLTVAMILLLLGPVSMLAAYVVRDGSDAVGYVASTLESPHVAGLVDQLPGSVARPVREAIVGLPRSLGELVAKVDSRPGDTAQVVGVAAAATGAFVYHAVLMFVALFFLLVRGDELVHWLDHVSPLRRGQTRELLATIGTVSRAVIVSSVVTSLLQAGAALIGFLIARVPNPIFFTLLTAIFAFVPAIGAAAVCLLAAVLLLLTGHPYMATFLAVWGLVVVGLVDNLAKPLLIRRGMEVHGGVVFFALIGGLSAFGAVGLVLGPLVVSLFLALVNMYHRDFSPADPRTPSMPGLPSRPEPAAARPAGDPGAGSSAA